ncbi:hypothetical protein EPN28_03495 [Patescibacteria group bacterium]|nr:MAG: hypothetical protein EPN28_03495 [Patescibacteria group bacterium]
MKKIIAVAAVIIVAAGLWYGFTLNSKKQTNSSNDYQKYENTAYGFSLEYPKTWHATGASATSTVISFNDTAPSEPVEGAETTSSAVIDIMIIENYDNISLGEWTDLSLGLGPELNILSEETIEANNTKFLVKTFTPLKLPEAAPTAAAFTALNDEKYFAQINYMGEEPNFTAGMKHFKHLLSSFQLTSAAP